MIFEDTLGNVLFTCLYLIPAVLTLIVLLKECVVYYKQDVRDRERYLNSTDKYARYAPTLTVGFILGNSIIAIIPVVNLFITLTEVVPKLWETFLKFFDIPLVPHKERTPK